MPRTFAFVAALALLFPVAASAAPPQRVVGGQNADAGEYPFQAYVETEYGANQYGRCGGSLIAARYVVTAGHCFRGGGGTAIAVDVAVGVTTVDQSQILANDPAIPADKKYLNLAFQVHPGFTQPAPGVSFNDVVVITLDRPAPEAQIRLPRPADAAAYPPGAAVVGTGWGLTQAGAADGTTSPCCSSNTLREVSMPVVADTTCQTGYGSANYSSELMICAGGQFGKDTCQGDSGGPLIASVPSGSMLAGVTSFGPTSCSGEFPGVYADVGVNPLNAFIRGLVPQVEIDFSALPEPGSPVTVTAVGSNPNGAYTSFEWDLDNDGAFDDGTGQSVPANFAKGIATLAVRASRNAAPATSDREIRKVDVDVRFRSPTAFAAPAVSVSEGDVLALGVVRQSGVGGAGGVLLVPSAGSAPLTPFASTPLGFAAGQASQTVSVPTVEDFLDEPDQTFRIEMGGHSGDLIPGAPGQVTVTVVDDDLPPSVKLTGKSSQKVKKNTVKVDVPVIGLGTLTVSIANSRGSELGRLTRTVKAPGTQKLSIKLNARGRRELRRSNRRKGLKVKLRATFTATGLNAPLTARRNLTLKR